MSSFRVLVVDDEPLARGTVVALLERDPEVRRVNECGDGRSAARRIRDERPDIVFLDIEMPELDGMAVAETLESGALPVFVFVTAFGEHAARAFEVEALDYVLKPFSDERFARALERAKRRVRELRLGELAEKVADLSTELDGSVEARSGAGESRGLERFTVREGGRTLIVRARDLVWIESQDYYVRLHTRTGSHLLRASLSALEEALPAPPFARVHRSAIVNLDEVEALETRAKGGRALLLSNGSRVPVSRSRRVGLERRLSDLD